METVGETPFKYQPLSSKHFSFRVLNVAPSANPDGLLICQLVTETFESTAPYDCISYVWGQEAPNKSMMLNGANVLIRENLWNGLRALRKADDSERNGRFAEKRIWADAICINQSDLEERNAQVARVKDIYAKAQGVAVWLGDRIQKKRISRDMASFLDDWTVKLDRVDWRPVPVTEKQTLEDREFAQGMADFLPWLLSSWWTRIWVLQEVAVSQRDPTFHYGDETLSWESCHKFLRLINGDAQWYFTDAQYQALKPIYHSYDKIQFLYEVRSSYQEGANDIWYLHKMTTDNPVPIPETHGSHCSDCVIPRQAFERITR